MKLKMLGLLGALVFAAPVAAVAGPAGGMTAQSASPLATPAVQTNAAVDANGPTAKVDKVYWRGGGGWRGGGWRGGWGRGYGWRGGWGGRRFGWGGYGWRGYRGFYGGWGWRRPYWGWRRRWWY